MKQSTRGGSINRRFSFFFPVFLDYFFFGGGGETKSARRNGEFAYRDIARHVAWKKEEF